MLKFSVHIIIDVSHFCYVHLVRELDGYHYGSRNCPPTRSSHPVFSGVRDDISSVFFVMFCRPLFDLLKFKSYISMSNSPSKHTNTCRKLMTFLLACSIRLFRPMSDAIMWLFLSINSIMKSRITGNRVAKSRML